MKILAATCALAILSSCPDSQSNQKKSNPGDATLRGKGNGNGDSPIVVSDGLYLRHHGQSSDFHLDNDNNNRIMATMDVTGSQNLYCIKKYDNCPDGTKLDSLANIQSINFYSQPNAQGPLVLTLQPDNGSSTVFATFTGPVTVNIDQSGDSTAHNFKGTEISQTGADFSPSLILAPTVPLTVPTIAQSQPPTVRSISNLKKAI